jgi:hypothetical protein
VTVCRVSNRLIVANQKFGNACSMADDLTNRGPADRARINVHEPHEVSYWTKALGVTEEKLKDAVKRVGVMADAVKRDLGK